MHFSETVVMTTNSLERGPHLLNLLIVDDKMNTQIKTFTVNVYRQADLKLSGEFDYLEKEKVKISIVVQIIDREDKFLLIPSGDIYFSVHLRIVNYNNIIKVPDAQMHYDSNGFFHWDSQFTIDQLINVFPKGIYIVQGWVEFSENSYYEGGNDVIQFHIDPPGSVESNSWLFFEILDFGGMAVLGIALVFLYLRKHGRNV